MKLCQCQKSKIENCFQDILNNDGIGYLGYLEDLYKDLQKPCTCQEKKEEKVGPYVVGQSFVVSPIDGQLKDETTLTDEEKEAIAESEKNATKLTVVSITSEEPKQECDHIVGKFTTQDDWNTYMPRTNWPETLEVRISELRLGRIKKEINRKRNNTWQWHPFCYEYGEKLNLK